MAAPNIYYQASTIANQTKTILEEAIKNLVQDEIPLMKPFEKNGKIKRKLMKAVDTYFKIPAEISYPASSRAVAKMGKLPPAGLYTDTQMTFSKRKIAVVSHLPWEDFQTGQGTNAFLESLPNMIKRHVMHDITFTVAQMFEGYEGLNGGIAKIFSITPDAGGSILKLYCHGGTAAPGQHEPGTLWTRMNQPVAVIDSDGSTVNDTTTISSYSDSETLVVADVSLTGAVGDFLVPGDSDGTQNGIAFTGLCDHVRDDGPTTYQGITRASYPALQANVLGNSGTSRALTDAEIFSEVWIQPMFKSGKAAKYDLVQIPPALDVAVSNLFADQRRFDSKEGMSLIDPRKTSIWGLEKIIDPYMAPGRIRFLESATFCIYYDGAWFEFEDYGTGSFLSIVGEGTVYDYMSALGRVYGQLVCTNPARNTAVEDLTQTPHLQLK